MLKSIVFKVFEFFYIYEYFENSLICQLVTWFPVKDALFNEFFFCKILNNFANMASYLIPIWIFNDLNFGSMTSFKNTSKLKQIDDKYVIFIINTSSLFLTWRRNIFYWQEPVKSFIIFLIFFVVLLSGGRINANTIE